MPTSSQPSTCADTPRPLGPGLYAITPDTQLPPEQLARNVRAALRGGARLIQYRAKSARDRLQEARLLLAECRAARVPLIINDDVELALAIGADGVHLGQEDGSPAAARTRLGATAIIGVTCHDSLDLAIAAERQGADYVAFGRFFPSTTKPGAPCARIETLSEAKRRLRIPIVAIGGITAANGRSLVAAGADLLAVIDGVFGTADPESAARALQGLFEV